MKRKVIILIKIIATIITAGCIAYLILVEKSTEYNEILRYTVLLCGFIYSFIKPSRVPMFMKRKLYEDGYKEFLVGSFCEDQRSYQKLLRCVECYTYGWYGKAHRILKSLEKKCIRSRDYLVVYAFHGFCYTREGKHAKAIAAYNKALEYDMMVSVVLSNLGLSHIYLNNWPEAIDALSKAIRYNAYNVHAHINMAHLFYAIGNPQGTLDYALKALNIKPDQCDAIGWAALGYKKLGDEENTKKYCDLYVLHGGKRADVKLILKKL